MVIHNVVLHAQTTPVASLEKTYVQAAQAVLRKHPYWSAAGHLVTFGPLAASLIWPEFGSVPAGVAFALVGIFIQDRAVRAEIKKP